MFETSQGEVCWGSSIISARPITSLPTGRNAHHAEGFIISACLQAKIYFQDSSEVHGPKWMQKACLQKACTCMHLFKTCFKKTGAKEADKYIWGNSLFYPLFNFKWYFRFLTKEGFWCWWHYVVCPKVFAVMWFLKWLACIMKKKTKVFDPMGTSGSVTSLQLVQRDCLLQNTANYAFVPWTIYIIET